MTSAAVAAILDAVHRLAIPSLVLACGSCTPPAPAPIQAPAVVQTPSPGSAPLVAAPVPEPTPATRRPAFVVAIDGAQADRFLVTLLAAVDPSLKQMAERELGFNPAALSQPSVLAVLGIDPLRPMLFGLASLDDRGRALVAGARSAAADSVGSDHTAAREQAVAKLVRERDGGEVHFSFVIPTIDSSVALDRIQRLLDKAAWKKSPEADGVESVWSHRDNLLAVGVSSGSITLDLADVGERGARAIPTLRVRSASLREALRAWAPPLEGNTARMTFSPGLVAEVGFLDALSTVHRAMRSLDEDYRGRILTQGFLEASRILELAGGSPGPYFESVELALQTSGVLPGVSGVATAGPSFPAPPAADCAPSVSLEFPDADVSYDAATACLRSFRLPGDPAGGELERSRHQDWTRDGGAWGRFAALPFLPGGIARERLSSLQGVAPGALRRFERFGWIGRTPTTRSSSVFWGLLPAGTGQKDAACAVLELGPRCTGKSVLTPGRTQEIERGWARLSRVGDRWAVLVASEKSALEKLSPALTRAPVAAMRVEVAAQILRRELPASVLSLPIEGWKWKGSALWEGNSFRVTFQPVRTP